MYIYLSSLSIYLLLSIFPSTATSNTYQQENKILYYNLKELYDTLFFPIDFGTPPKEINLCIDFHFNFNIVTPVTFFPTSSNTATLIEKKNIFIDHEEYESHLYEDRFYPLFTDITIPKLHFYFWPNSRRFNTLGLANTYTELQFSVIHKLYNIYEIEEKSFGFNYQPTTDGGNNYRFFLGGFPNSWANANKHKLELFVNKTYPYWGVNPDKLVLNHHGKVLELNATYASFQWKTDMILVNKAIMNFILEEYFDITGTKKDWCDVDTYSGNSIVYCDCSSIHLFGNITWIMNSTTGEGMTLTYEELFKEGSSTCKFLIGLSEHIIGSIQFGYMIVKRYKMWFSYESDSISWYNNEEFFNTWKGDSAGGYTTAIRWWLLSVDIFICCWSVLLLLVYLKIVVIK